MSKVVTSPPIEPPTPQTAPAEIDQESTEAGTRTARRRLDRTRPIALPLLLLAFPVVGYLVFIAVYGVNTIVVDQWADISLLQKVYAGHAGFAAFWAPHNENRTLFPNLVVVALADLTRLNITLEYYINAVLLIAAASVVVVAHRRRALTRRSLYWYFPVVALMLTLAQFYNTLTGFQLAWYVALAAIVVTLAILDRDKIAWPALAIAIIVGTVGSYSTLEGLFVWPAGLVLLLLRRRGWPHVGAWVASAIVVTALYVNDLTLGPPKWRSTDLHSPLIVAKFFLIELGDVLGYSVPTHGDATTQTLLMVAGAVVLVVSVLALWQAVRSIGEPGPAPFGAALIIVGITFAIVTALGRTLLGTFAASASRFVTFDVLPIVGSYLVFLAVPPALKLGGLRRRAVPVLAAAVMLVIASFGLYHGIGGGQATRTYDNAASDVIVNIDKAPGYLVIWDVYPLIDAGYVRALVPVARAHHLSLFDTPVAAIDARRGLYVGLSIKWP